jgi:hypothetical protein
MNSPTSLDLISHFDGPLNVAPTHALPVRGVGWVLTWAAALGVLAVSASILTDFAYCLAAEHALARAARAGALEATLPRATTSSVVESVKRRLVGYSLPSGALHISIMQNGQPVRGRLEMGGDDEFSVAVSLSTNAVVPNWLQQFLIWRDETRIEARANSHIPGRKLKIARL